MPYRKPRRSKLEINDFTVLVIWALIAYLLYKVDPEGTKQAFQAMWKVITYVIPLHELRLSQIPAL